MHSFITNTIPQDPHTTIGTTIEAVRELQHLLSFKMPHIIVIPAADQLSLPAQHALLKTLEEPPPDTTIYLVTSHPDLLLPTILSRCQFITNPHTIPNPAQQSQNLLDKLLSAKSVGDRLLLLDSAKFDRASALQFLSEVEIILHEKLNASYNLPPISYQLISDTRKYLMANCNLKLVLDYLATNMSLRA